MALGTPYKSAGGNAGTGSAALTVTLTHAVATGDAHAVWVTTNAGSISGVADSKSNAYYAGPVVTNGSLVGQWFTALNCVAMVSGTDTVTLTLSGTTSSKTLTGFGCSGAATAGGIDQLPAPATGTSAAPSLASQELTWAYGELALAGLVSANAGGAVTWTGTMATPAASDSEHPGTAQFGSAAAQPVTGTPTVTASGTITPAAWGLSLLTLRSHACLVGATVGRSIYGGANTVSAITNTISTFESYLSTSFAYTATNGSPCVFTAANSTYANGAQVKLSGGTAPTGFTNGTTYYVVGASGATFNLSATSGGAAINSTSTGNGTVSEPSRPLGHLAGKVYYNAPSPATNTGGWPATLPPEAQAMINLGSRITLCHQAGGLNKAKTASERTALADAIVMYQNAGATIDVCGWQEPNNGDFTSAAAFQSWFAYYAVVCHNPAAYSTSGGGLPVPSSYCPVVGSGNAGIDGAVAYYPGDAYTDKVIADFYGSGYTTAGGHLDELATLCDGHSPTPIPLGLGEWNAVAGNANSSIAVPDWNKYINYLLTFFGGRALRADLLFWIGNNVISKPQPADNVLSTSYFTVPGNGNSGAGGFGALGIHQMYDTLSVAAVAPLLVTRTGALPNGSPGVPYSQTLSATGGVPPYTWAITAGALPAGLHLDAGSGTISGSPTTTGTASFTVQVTDTALTTATAALSITIAASALTIPAQSLPGGTVASPYAGAVTATGGTPPYTWTLTAGSLPTGLTLAAAGTIGGTPGAAGVTTFTLTVTDHVSATAASPFTITVTAAATLAVTTGMLPNGTAGQSYSTGLGATGGTPPYTWAVTSGTLPPGVTLSAASGVLSGVPLAGSLAAAAYPFTVRVTDSLSATASANLSVTVFTVIAAPAVKGPWRILWAAPQPTGTILGEVLQAQNKTVTLRSETGQNHEVSFDVDGHSPAAAGILELQTDIQVMFGSELVFCGRVVPTQDTLTAASHRVVFTALDYREVLRRRAILPGDQVSWAAVEQATIAWNLIQHTQSKPGGALGIARGIGQTTGKQRTMTFTTGDYVSDDIDVMANLASGFEWQITPYNPADLRLDVFSPQMGENNGVVLAWGDARISSIVRAVDPSTYADAVYVTGNTGSSLTAQQIDATDITTRVEGRWDITIGTNLKTQDPLNDAATADLAQAEVVIPAYTVTFYPGAWDGPDWLFLGDTVTLQIDSGRLQVNQQLRVIEMAFAISPDNLETLTLTIGALPFRLNKKIPSMLRRLRYLELRLWLALFHSPTPLPSRPTTAPGTPSRRTASASSSTRRSWTPRRGSSSFPAISGRSGSTTRGRRTPRRSGQCSPSNSAHPSPERRTPWLLPYPPDARP